MIGQQTRDGSPLSYGFELESRIRHAVNTSALDRSRTVFGAAGQALVYVAASAAPGTALRLMHVHVHAAYSPKVLSYN